MDLGMQGRKAVITGATRGIGRAIAETLADAGADVAFCARDLQQVQTTVQALKSKGVQAFGARVDVADGQALKAWIAEAGRQLGGIDILVSNASALAMGNGEQDWSDSVAIDLMGAVRSVEAASPLLEQAAARHGDACVIIISSAAAAETDYETSYGAVKAALIHFAKGAARRLALKGVRVNVVSPGTVYFKDGFWHKVEQHMPDMYQAWLARNPMGRMARPEEVAQTAVFLASPRSSFTSGANIVIDGALTVRVNY
jgi:3-oxoacyl-[acyl-carrier protein] reductase